MPDINTESLFLNGIDGSTGDYLPGPTTKLALAKLVLGETDKRVVTDIKNRTSATKDHYGPIPSVDPQNLAQAGWGVIFPQATDNRILEQLRPLLDLRKKQAGDLYKEYTGNKGYLPEQSKFEWSNGSTGLVDPKDIPYYLLIVGDPDIIPYSFQFQLDIQFAVGRIHFDNIEDYGAYAQSVVAAEEGKTVRQKRASYFGVVHKGDGATEMSWGYLAKPLAEKMAPAWKTAIIGPEEAKKAKLATLMGGPDTPAFLFTASHGLGFPNPADSERQYRRGGALMCGDYPGPRKGVALTEDAYFCGEDISSSSNLGGMIAFFFACYGAGTPKENSFPMKDSEEVARQLAPSSFVANLPKRMLSRGALAVVGHVDRAWTYSYYNVGTDDQNTTFRSTLDLLLNQGSRIGFAMEPFNSRYAELSSPLAEALGKNRETTRDNLTFLWTRYCDARNYAVIGDPAVKICAADNVTADKIEFTAPIVVSAPPLRPENVSPVVTSASAKPSIETLAQQGVDSALFGANISEAVEQIRTKLGAALDRTLEGLSTLEVITYTSDSSMKTDLSEGIMEGTKQRAMTRIELTGRTQSCIPTTDGKIDEALWKLHMEMVDKAMAHRTAMWKLATDVAAQAVGWLKK